MKNLMQRIISFRSRVTQQQVFDEGEFPKFRETKTIRDGNWTAGGIPHDLQDRRVELQVS
jgi:malate synthase